jgi:hypothetical protein
VLGDAFALLRAADGLVAPGAAAVLGPVRPAGLDAPADPAPRDGGRALCVPLAAGAEGVGLVCGAELNAPETSTATIAMPVTTAAPTAIAAARRRWFRRAASSRRMAPVPVADDMRGGTDHSSET